LRVLQFRFISVRNEGLKTEDKDESALINCNIGRAEDIVSLFALVTTHLKKHNTSKKKKVGIKPFWSNFHRKTTTKLTFRAFALLRSASFFTSSQLKLKPLSTCFKRLCFTSLADTAPQKLKPFRGIKREQECSSRRVNLFAVDAKETYAQACCKIFSLFYFPYQLKKNTKTI